MSKSFFGFIVLLASVFVYSTSCTTTSQETINLSLSASAEGPFFEGPNSLMADIDLSNYTTSEGVEIAPENIAKATLSKISVSLNQQDSIDFQSFTSASFQMVSSDFPMTSAIAILNPIESNSNTIELTSSDEADLADYLRSKKFTGILDLELTEYLEKERIGAEINLEFTLEIKK